MGRHTRVNARLGSGYASGDVLAMPDKAFEVFAIPHAGTLSRMRRHGVPRA